MGLEPVLVADAVGADEEHIIGRLRCARLTQDFADLPIGGVTYMRHGRVLVRDVMTDKIGAATELVRLTRDEHHRGHLI